MRQVLIRRGQVVVEDVPAPLIEEGQVLVEVAYSLISTGTELSTLQASGQSTAGATWSRPGKLAKLVDHLRTRGIHKTVEAIRDSLEVRNQPLALGYSCSGVVVQVGKDVTHLSPGDWVACAGAGKANHAELVLVPKNLVVKIPDGCPLRLAASVALGAIAMQGVRRAGADLGDIVGVIGLGLVGQLTVQLLKVSGCRVIGIDLDSRRVELARQLGADSGLVPGETDTFNEIRDLTSGHGIDVTIVAASSASNEIIQQAMRITRKKGRVVIVGDVGLAPKRSPFYEKELDLLISCSYGPGRYDARYEDEGLDYPYAYVRWTENRNMEEYLRLIADGRIALEPILEQEYDIGQAAEAYKALQTGSSKPLGVLLRYDSGDRDVGPAKSATKLALQHKRYDGRINIAVVGAGSFAKAMHLPNLRRLNNLYHLRAIVSASGSNAKATGQMFGADYASTNYEDVLNDPDVDAVLIATRHHQHAGQVAAALRAGKHVYCEKPLAITEAELDIILECFGLGIADLMTEPSRFSDLVLTPRLMVGFNRRFSPLAQRMKGIVMPRQNPMVMTYRVNAGYLAPEHWVHGPQGAGRIIGEACHMLDFFQFLTGAPVQEADVLSLNPNTEHILSSDNVCAILRYSDGSVGSLIYTSLGNDRQGKERLELFVDGKVLVMDDFWTLKVLSGQNDKLENYGGDKGHFEALEFFAQTIKGHVAPTSDFFQTTLTSMKIALHNE